MCTAVGGVDVVGEGADIVVVAVVILHGDLYLTGVLHIRRAQIDDLVVDRIVSLFLMDIIDELADTALVIEDLVNDMLGISLVLELDIDARVQKRLFSQSAREDRIIINVGILEDLGIGFEANLGTALCGFTDLLQIVHDLAALVALEIDILAVAYSDLEPLGQRVDDRSADAVQTAGYLVSAAAELTAGVQYGKDDRDRRQTHLGIDTHRDTAAVILDADDVAGQDRNIDLVAIACQRLVDRVIDDLIDQMMQTAFTGGAYVHTGTFTDSFQTLEYLDLIRAVFALDLCHFFFINYVDSLDRRLGSFYELFDDLFYGSDFFILLLQDNSSVLHDSKAFFQRLLSLFLMVLIFRFILTLFEFGEKGNDDIDDQQKSKRYREQRQQTEICHSGQ